MTIKIENVISTETFEVKSTLTVPTKILHDTI